jgi:hypothetical protein
MISADTRSVIDRAKQLYADRLQPALEAEHRGRFVAVSCDARLGCASSPKSQRSSYPFW